MTSAMTGALTMRALSAHALRVLMFLAFEHMANGGQENGRLGASHRQLTAWGVTKGDVSQGLAELIAAGFVRLMVQGACVAGGGEPSRYALTWLPTIGASGAMEPPTHDWRRILVELHRSQLTTPAQVRAWLKAETGGGRSARKRATPKI